MKWAPTDRVPRTARLDVLTIGALGLATVLLWAPVIKPGPYPVTMFFPPAGGVFAYLVLTGPAGIPAAAAVLALGALVIDPAGFGAHLLPELGSASLLGGVFGLSAYPLHGLWRDWRRRHVEPAPFQVLTVFLLTGLLCAPLLAALAEYGLAALLSDRPTLGAAARLALGTTTAVATVTPLCLAAAVVVTGRSPDLLREALDGRREALVPATVILLAPLIALCLPGAGVAELWLVPLAAAPLFWISLTGDLTRSAAVLALSALVIGILAGRLFGETGGLYRSQVMVLCCALAGHYVAAGVVTGTRTRREEEAADSRWRALVEAAPAQVARIAADGTWSPQSADDADGPAPAPPRTTADLLPERERREIRAALRDRRPRTLYWQTPSGRRFVTRVTPLPDGETLVVTTETTEPLTIDLPGVEERADRRPRTLLLDVAGAVDRAELAVVYQPDVDPANGHVHGIEALVRWRRPDGLLVATDDFVRMAEQAGSVAAIDDWVMRAALTQLAQWRRTLPVEAVELGVNVSALSLTAGLPDRLTTLCEEAGIPPGQVRLEVTETALGDDGRTVEVLRAARARGFRVALDDFGTGYASLSRLRTLPVDVIKLDRSFLAALTDDPAAQTLVGMILGLAEPLELDVVVEGVETRAQRDVLVNLGCRRAQGFLFARPTSPRELRTLLLDPLAFRR
jgi:EAL domain-containing protein (putative c-di-GMP-specific phosphodiesterase class I)